MCGIAGWIDFHQDIGEQDGIPRKMADTMLRRGPDEGGFYGERHLWLVHRRLSVVDPLHGKQPMALEYGGTRYHLVYNGELYNTKDLREQLKTLGHEFQENSDTEVLLHAYAQWGADCLQQLNGIFAFAVWDHREQRLFLARDRMGVKPLFFFPLEGGLVFGSLITTLLAHPSVEAKVDADGLRELFFLGPGRSGGQGVFKGVRELMPGQCAVLDREGLRLQTYWTLEAREHTDDYATTVERTGELVQDAIRRQLVSDVPLCCFLSGGLDSSIISKIAADSYRQEGRQLTTYSVDYQDNEQYFTSSVFQPNSDDAYIDLMQRHIGSDHRRVVLQNTHLAEALPAAMRARNLPGMADIDASLLLFCRRIREDFTVGVSGECADELFGGYPWYHNREILFDDCFPWSRSLALRQSILRDGAVPGGEDYVRQGYLDTVARTGTLPGDTRLERRMRQMMMLNLHWFMQTLLDRKDRMSMDCGLEVRVPFCDHRIVEYAYNMPWTFKSKDGREKGILRDAVSGLLPHDIVWRKKSPYPKTHNPIFLQLVRSGVEAIRQDRSSPLHQLLDWDGVEQIIQSPDSVSGPWYGQLMGAPQVLAYLVQLDAWFREFKVQLV